MFAIKMRDKNKTFVFYLFFAVLREFMGQPRVEVIQEGSNFAGNISPGNSIVLGCKSPVGYGTNKVYVARQGKNEIDFSFVSLFQLQ